MDQIYYNGSFLTMSPLDFSGEPIEAVWVHDGQIAAVGSVDKLKEAAGHGAEWIDLKGRCMMPAFLDSHGHFVMNGQMALCADLKECKSFQDICDALTVFLQKSADKKQPVIGYGYDHNFLKEGRHPDRNVLDRVSQEIPIFILHISAHMACANTAALRLASITADTPDPEGGLIGRRDGGRELTGYLEETAIQRVQTALAAQIRPDLNRMMQGMQEIYLKHGITTVQDGASTMQDLQLLDGMSKTNRLLVDVVSYPLLTAGGEKTREAFAHLCGGYRGHLRIGGYKLVLDGSPQGRSAWMSSPYLGGEEGYCGYPWLSDEEVQKYIRIALTQGQQLLAHCNGDAASEQFIRCYAKVKTETGICRDLRPVMIHCQTVRSDQLDRMRQLGMIASVFVGHVWYWGDIHLKNFGEARGNRISPAKDALDKGVVVSFHQDTPVTKPDMLHSVWCAINRISRGGTVIGEEQKIPVYEALKAVTINAAYQYFEESDKGSIETGKTADLVILDRSPLQVKPEEIREIQVLATIRQGKVVYAI